MLLCYFLPYEYFCHAFIFSVKKKRAQNDNMSEDEDEYDDFDGSDDSDDSEVLHCHLQSETIILWYLKQ